MPRLMQLPWVRGAWAGGMVEATGPTSDKGTEAQHSKTFPALSVTAALNSTSTCPSHAHTEPPACPPAPRLLVCGLSRSSAARSSTRRRHSPRPMWISAHIMACRCCDDTLHMQADACVCAHTRHRASKPLAAGAPWWALQRSTALSRQGPSERRDVVPLCGPAGPAAKPTQIPSPTSQQLPWPAHAAPRPPPPAPRPAHRTSMPWSR